jgi:hypothetical protein
MNHGNRYNCRNSRLTGSLLFGGWQTRQLAHQTRTQNLIAGATSVDNAADRLNSTYRVFVDYPQLRKYFYEGVAFPTEELERAQVLTVAELRRRLAKADVAETLRPTLAAGLA